MQTLSRGLLILGLTARYALGGTALAEDAQDDAVALQGFDLAWEKRPHRLNVIGVGLRAGVGGPVPWTEVRGGTWANGEVASDDVRAMVHGVRLEGGARVVRGGTESFALTGSWARRPSERAQVVATHRIAVTLPEPAEAAAVWISGFHVAAGPDHPDGYTIRGLTVWVGPVTVTGDQALFEITAVTLASAAPSRVQDLEVYTAAVTVDWTMVTARAEEISRAEADIEARRRRRFFAEPDPPLHGALAGALPEGAAGAFIGCSGFSFLLDGRGQLDGRFWRQLTVDLDERQVSDRGWTARAALRLSNAGTITRPTWTTARASWTALALAPDERVTELKL